MKYEEPRAHYDEDINCIVIDTGINGYTYEVALRRCTTPGAVLDWIHQVCVAKTWGPGVTKDFLEVLFTVIPDTFWSGKA